jgi:integrase
MGGRQDRRNIQVYETKKGTKYRVQMRVNGERINEVFDAEDEARRYRNKLADSATEGSDLPRKVAGLALLDLIMERWWPDEEDGARGTLAQSTRKKYWSHILRFLAPYKQLAEKDITLITAEDITGWQRWAKKEGASYWALVDTLKPISGALTWAARQPSTYGLQANPVTVSGWPKNDSEDDDREPHPFPPLVVERVRRELLRPGTPGAERDAMLLNVMHQAGLRPWEARKTEVRNFQQKTISLAASQTKKPGKGRRRSRTPTLYETLREDVEGYVERRELGRNDLLVGLLDGSFMGKTAYDNWRRRFDAARNRVHERMLDSEAIEYDPNYDGSLLDFQVRPYDLGRHSYVAMRIQAGHPLNVIAKATGHRIDTMARYYDGVIEEYGERGKIDLVEEIQTARAKVDEEEEARSLAKAGGAVAKTRMQRGARAIRDQEHDLVTPEELEEMRRPRV